MNVFGSFSALISNVKLMEDMPSNMNMVHDQSFENVIDCLKAMSIVPHSSNKLKSLDYNKIKIQYVSFMPITFNDNIISELPPIYLQTSHFGQMQGMDRKYDGHAWCKVKTSNIKNNFGLGFISNKCLGHLHCDNDSCEHFLHFFVQNKISWTGDSTQIPLIGQFASRPLVCTIVCRFCVASPLCVNTCPCLDVVCYP
jgi:hypothetical protein